MLLVDSTNEAVDQTPVTASGNGVYNYTFPHVAPGSYRIIGGSDIDNDVFICQLGEACGGYPTINALSEVDVGESDIVNLDFVVDILANFGASSLSSGSPTGRKVGGIGFKRMINLDLNPTSGSSTSTKNKQLPQ